MRPKQNDFIVEEMADAERPYRLWATDLIRSPTRKRLVDALEIMVRCWDRSIDPADLVTQFGAQVAYTKAQFQRMRDVADYDLKRRIVERNRLEDLKLWPEYIEGRWSA